MNRAWIVGLCGLVLVGCASPRVPSKREVPSGENSPFDDLSSIHQTINGGAPRSVEVAKALEAPKHAVGAVPVLAPDRDAKAVQVANRPPEFEPEPAPKPSLIPIPAGRPAPYAEERPDAPRPQVAPDPRISDRAAPYADERPENPRPQAPPAFAPSQRPAVEMPPPGPTTSVPAPPPLLAAPTTDPAVRPTGGTTIPRKRSELDIVGRPAARVGDEIITVHQLRAAVSEKLEQVPPQERTPQIQKMVVDRILENLIDRALILQAAKRQFKDPKNLNMFYEMIEKVWTEHELPPLYKIYGAKNVYELKARLAEKGKSYEEMHEEFRRNTLAQEFLGMKMKEKLTVSLPEMRSYYDKHLKEYDRPAQLIWREISIDLAKYPTRAAAKQKADQILAQLRRGADFGELAKKESQGPTASRGGRWETSPGSYGVESVNNVLERLPVNQLSPIVEAPASFHIVRVEERRAAGPARFDEVQDQVRASVAEEKRRDAASKYVASLRDKTMITTMFDAPESDPSAMKVGAEAPRR